MYLGSYTSITKYLESVLLVLPPRWPSGQGIELVERRPHTRPIPTLPGCSGNITFIRSWARCRQQAPSYAGSVAGLVASVFAILLSIRRNSRQYCCLKGVQHWRLLIHTRRRRVASRHVAVGQFGGVERGVPCSPRSHALTRGCAIDTCSSLILRREYIQYTIGMGLQDGCNSYGSIKCLHSRMGRSYSEPLQSCSWIRGKVRSPGAKPL
jgi:hypothetical protein